jgi:hypothetical protein
MDMLLQDLPLTFFFCGSILPSAIVRAHFAVVKEKEKKNRREMHATIPAMIIMGLLTIGLLVGTLVLVINVKARLPAVTVVPNNRHLRASTCCDYSLTALPALIDELQTFVRQTLKSGERFTRLKKWEDFPQVYPDLETVYVNNTYLAYVASLRPRILKAQSYANVSTLEKMQLNAFLAQVDLVVNLSKVNGLWMQYGLKTQYVALINDPLASVFDFFALIPNYQDEPDYADKLLVLYTQLTAKLTRYTALGARMLDGETVHASLSITTQATMASGSGYDDVHAMNFTLLCVNTLTGADLAACIALGHPLDALLADFTTWWTTDYTDGCAALRPNTAPGLQADANGTQIYDILQTYHLGMTINETAVNLLGVAGVEEVLTLFDTYSVNLGFSDTNDLLAGLANANNAVLYECTNLTQSAIDAVNLATIGVNTKLSAMFGFLPRRSAMEVGISGNVESFYIQGAHNSSTQFWQVTDYYNVGQLGTCTGTNFHYYGLATRQAVIARTAMPGGALQANLASEIECSILGDEFEGNTEFQEGWAVHGMYLCLEMGCYPTNLTQTGYYRMRSLYDNRLIMDTCLHGNASNVTDCTVTEAEGLATGIGFTSAQALYETVRALNMPAQGLAARLGDLKFLALRVAAQTAIEDANKTFSPREFYNAILRFGPGLLVNETAALIDTYVALAVGNTTVSTDFGADLLPAHLYSSCNPSVGLGSNAACAADAFAASAELNLTSYTDPSPARVRFEGDRFN